MNISVAPSGNARFCRVGSVLAGFCGWHRAGPQVQVREVQPGTAGFGQVLTVVGRVLAQDRHLSSRFPHAQESHLLGAFDGTRCAGFLRYLIQVIGAEAGRPAVMHHGEPLREGYVEAFGVDPRWRRRGIGTALQQHAAHQPGREWLTPGPDL